MFVIGCLVDFNITDFIMIINFQNVLFYTGKIQMRQTWYQLHKQTFVVHRQRIRRVDLAVNVILMIYFLLCTLGWSERHGKKNKNRNLDMAGQLAVAY